MDLKQLQEQTLEITNLGIEVLACESPRSILNLGIKALGLSMYLSNALGAASAEAGQAYIERKVKQAQVFLNSKNGGEGKPPSDAVCENMAEVAIAAERKFEAVTQALAEQIKNIRQDAIELINLAKKKADMICQENMKIGS